MMFNRLFVAVLTIAVSSFCLAMIFAMYFTQV
jgi:hypothetical protein